MGGPDPYRHDRVSFKKRTHTLLDKGNQLASLLGAKVYLVIEHPRGTIVYNSDESKEWPPPETKIVSYTLSYKETVFINWHHSRIPSTRLYRGSPRHRKSLLPRIEAKVCLNIFATDPSFSGD